MRHLLALLISTSLLITPALAAEKDADTGKARMYTEKEIQKIVLDTLMKHPETIINSLEVMQAKKEKEDSMQQEDAVEAYKTSLFHHAESPYAGNKDGDVTVVEFYDFNCGYCKRSLPNVLQLLEEDKNVKFVFKDYPVLAPSSEDAAKASIAMFQLNPERYLDFHAALYRLGGKFDHDNLASIAEGMGVDKDDFLKALESDEVAKVLKENADLGQKLGVRGVPLFVIGTKIFPGAVSIGVLKKEIAAAREAAKKD